MNRITTRLGFTTLALVAGGAAFAQSTQTGTYTVTVTDAAGLPLAGVRVELKSSSLPGPRVGITDAKGIFRAPLLPPGSYEGIVTKEGFIPAKLEAAVPLGGAISSSVKLKAVETQSATVVVVATTSKLEKSDVQLKENFLQDDILKLPVGRTLAGITQLAPEVTTGAGGRAVIGGSATYENKFLVNGTDINDNYFNTDDGLFIEDAIEETQVLTNNVSAEYGRFLGGVINSITKRGGNTFEGSLRASASNSAWNAVLPLQNRSAIVNKLNTIYTGTFGGPIIKDKLWFFTAVRLTSRSDTNNLPFSGYTYTTGTDEKRYELNSTWQINPDNRVTGSYIYREITGTGRAPLVNNTADLNALYNRKDPFSLYAVSWDSILSSSLSLNVSYSRKTHKITNSDYNGNGGSAFWQSPVFDQFGAQFNNHYFGNVPEYRNNDSIKATLAYFFSAAGSHELKIGVERFREINEGTNSQSPTGYVIDTGNVTYPQATPGPITYDFNPTDSYLEDWTLSPGGKFTSKYLAAFVNDNWAINTHWNLSLGIRYEGFEGESSAGFKTPKFSDVVPRLGVTFDPSGDGSWQLSGTYAIYAGKANAAITTAGTYVGNPAVYYYGYTGPTVTGVTAAPGATGFQRSDYDTVPFLVNDPVLNVRLDSNLKAPRTFEGTLGLKRKVGASGSFTLTYINRTFTRLFEDYIGDQGSTLIAGTPYSFVVWGNTKDNEARRSYRALVSTFENNAEIFGGRLTYRGNLTLSRLRGNYEGDGGNLPGGGTAIGSYERSEPNSVAEGFLPNDEPVRIKAQALWARLFGKNQLTFGFNFNYASGKPYNLTRTAPTIADPLGVYVDRPQTYTRFFGNRGVGRFADTHTIDFSAEWSGKFGFGGAAKNVGYFVKFTALNVLNEIQQATWDVRSAPGVNAAWAPRNTFGRPISANNYVGNRQILADVGFRF